MQSKRFVVALQVSAIALLVLGCDDHSSDSSFQLAPIASAKHPLNDTGIILCGDYAFDDTGYSGSGIHNNDINCAVVGATDSDDGAEPGNGLDAVPAGQDAGYGRDADPERNDESDGYKGFSYTKLGADGMPLPVQDEPWNDLGSESLGSLWSCVLDNVTGLIWEVKINDGGLRDKDWTYTWYNRSSFNNGGDIGVGDTGVRTTTDSSIGSDNCSNPARCDSEKFVDDVNLTQLCGRADWRLPSADELRSVQNLGQIGIAIDTTFFPNTISNWYWSASPLANHDNHAWIGGLNDGFERFDQKSTSHYVLLVRGG